MPDILIRNVPDDVLASIDANARRRGLSRNEYLRRALDRERTAPDDEITVADLDRFAVVHADLDDPGVMGDAWS